MDADRFDSFTRAFDPASRRRFTQSLAGLTFSALVPLLGLTESEAGKKGKGKKGGDKGKGKGKGKKKKKTNDSRCNAHDFECNGVANKPHCCDFQCHECCTDEHCTEELGPGWVCSTGTTEDENICIPWNF